MRELLELGKLSRRCRSWRRRNPQRHSRLMMHMDDSRALFLWRGRNGRVHLYRSRAVPRQIFLGSGEPGHTRDLTQYRIPLWRTQGALPDLRVPRKLRGYEQILDSALKPFLVLYILSVPVNQDQNSRTKKNKKENNRKERKNKKEKTASYEHEAQGSIVPRASLLRGGLWLGKDHWAKNVSHGYFCLDLVRVNLQYSLLNELFQD